MGLNVVWIGSKALLFHWGSLQLNWRLCCLRSEWLGMWATAWEMVSASAEGDQSMAVHKVRVWDAWFLFRWVCSPEKGPGVTQDEKADLGDHAGRWEERVPQYTLLNSYFNKNNNNNAWFPPSSLFLFQTVVGKPWLGEGGLWFSCFYHLLDQKERP